MSEDVVIQVKGEGGYIVVITRDELAVMSRSNRRRIEKAGMLTCGKCGAWKKAKALRVNTDLHRKPICSGCIREIIKEKAEAEAKKNDN